MVKGLRELIEDMSIAEELLIKLRRKLNPPKPKLQKKYRVVKITSMGNQQEWYENAKEVTMTSFDTPTEAADWINYHQDNLKSFAGDLLSGPYKERYEIRDD